MNQVRGASVSRLVWVEVRMSEEGRTAARVAQKKVEWVGRPQCNKIDCSWIDLGEEGSSARVLTWVEVMISEVEGSSARRLPWVKMKMSEVGGSNAIRSTPINIGINIGFIFSTSHWGANHSQYIVYIWWWKWVKWLIDWLSMI